MDIWMLVGLLGVVALAGVLGRELLKPTKIDVPNGIDNWMIICVLIMFMYFGFFLLHSKLLEKLAFLSKKNMGVEKIAYYIIVSVSIIALIYLGMWLSGIAVRHFELDYQKNYSGRLFKNIFIVYGIAFFIKVIILVLSMEPNDSLEELVVQLVSWIVTIGSLALDFDHLCESSSERNARKKKKRMDRRQLDGSNEKNKINFNSIKMIVINNKETIGVYIVMLSSIVLILSSEVVGSVILLRMIILGFAFSFAFLIIAVCMKYKYNPSICLSAKRFRRVFDGYKQDNKMTKICYFGKMAYYIENKEIKIQAVKLEYDFEYKKGPKKKLFEELTIPIQKPGDREYYVYKMSKRYFDQKAFIDEAYKHLKGIATSE